MNTTYPDYVGPPFRIGLSQLAPHVGLGLPVRRTSRSLDPIRCVRFAT